MHVSDSLPTSLFVRDSHEQKICERDYYVSEFGTFSRHRVLEISEDSDSHHHYPNHNRALILSPAMKSLYLIANAAAMCYFEYSVPMLNPSPHWLKTETSRPFKLDRWPLSHSKRHLLSACARFVHGYKIIQPVNTWYSETALSCVLRVVTIRGTIPSLFFLPRLLSRG